jgi:DNA-binding transcriptional MerR regulator
MATTMIVEPIFLTKQQAAEALSCSVRHLDNLEKEGLLTPIRRGRWVRYAVDDLHALREKLTKKPEPPMRIDE